MYISVQIDEITALGLKSKRSKTGDSAPRRRYWNGIPPTQGRFGAMRYLATAFGGSVWRIKTYYVETEG